MATTIEGTFVVPADQAIVWAGLNDPEVLKACIAGCENVEKRTDTDFYAIARVKIGPLKTSVRGHLELRDVDPPNGCRLIGEGQGGLAGFARGEADIRLSSGPYGTTITYALEASVGGYLTRLSGRVLDAVAQRMAEAFFASFSAAVVSRQRLA